MVQTTDYGTYELELPDGLWEEIQKNRQEKARRDCEQARNLWMAMARQQSVWKDGQSGWKHGPPHETLSYQETLDKLNKELLRLETKQNRNQLENDQILLLQRRIFAVCGLMESEIPC